MRPDLLLIPLALSACVAGGGSFSSGPPNIPDDVHAALAPAIAPVLDDFFPGAPRSAATDCVIAGASADEIAVLSAPRSRAATDAVLAIANRPDTLDCITTVTLAGALS